MPKRLDPDTFAWIDDPPPPLVVPPRPGQWFYPQRVTPACPPWALGVVAFSLLMMLGGIVRETIGVAYAGAAVFLALVLYGILTDRDARSPAFVEALMEDPDDLNVCPVEIHIVRARRLIGKDRGAAWFEDGTLLYSGVRTSFVLGGENILPKAEWAVFRDAEGEIGLPEHGLPLRIDGVGTYVAFTPLRWGDGGASYRQELRFLPQLKRLREGRGTTSGLRQWPPVERI